MRKLRFKNFQKGDEMLRVLFALLIFSFACSSFAFMSDDEIAKEMKISKHSDVSTTMNEHIAHLKPVKEFFTAEQLANKRSSQTSYTGKGSVDLRNYDSPIENQWDGTCTAHAMRNVIDNKARSEVSTRHIWSKYKQYSCEAAIKAWENKSCITSAEAWPQNKTKPKSGYLNSENCNTFLKKAVAIESDIGKMKKALDNENPVYLGIVVTRSMVNCDKALDPNSPAIDGGHALAIVGYKDDSSIPGGGYFIIKNSWGTDCADNGYQYVPFNYCNSRSDMFCQMWEIGKAEINYEPKCIKWKRLWHRPWKECIKWE